MPRVIAPAKLTLSLRVTGVRADGYHLLAAEMVSIDLCDDLSFSEGEGLDITGLAVPTSVPGDNLVNRALVAVGRRAHVALHKRIPAGAGLGGGSTDAAAVLRWAGGSDVGVAASLGADVVFCLRGGRARVSGIGDEIEPMAHVDATYTLLIPPLHVATPAVYRMWDTLGGPTADGPNDLEAAALAVCPELALWRDRLGESTGLTPLLAGSGATWFVPGSFPDVGLVVHTLPAAWPEAGGGGIG